MLISMGINPVSLFKRKKEDTPCGKGIFVTEVTHPFHSKKRAISEFFCPVIFEMTGLVNAVEPEYDEDGVRIEPPTLNCIDYVV